MGAAHSEFKSICYEIIRNIAPGISLFSIFYSVLQDGFYEI